MEPLYVVKIGGNVIDDSAHLHKFLKDLAVLKGAKILVHGGGKVATKLAGELGIEAQMIEGRRVTDIETLRVVTMVYAGLINKNIVAQLQYLNCNAMGLTGADGNFIKAVKRPIKRGADGQPIDFGFVGDLNEGAVNVKGLQSLLQAGFVPVFSAITHDGEGQLLNTNADTIASVLAVGLSKVYDTHLVYCFEKKGVLRDINDETSVISQITPTVYQQLKADKVIADGMVPKLDNAFDAIRKGVGSVIICKADDLLTIQQENKAGTHLMK